MRKMIFIILFPLFFIACLQVVIEEISDDSYISEEHIVSTLPPISKELPINTEADKRNLLNILANKRDEILAKGEPVSIKDLKELVIKHITNNGRDPNYSDSPQDAMISLKNSKGTSYDTYVRVLNEVRSAYTEMRDGEAMKQFSRKCADLSEEDQKKIRAVYPIKILEKGPQDSQPATPQKEIKHIINPQRKTPQIIDKKSLISHIYIGEFTKKNKEESEALTWILLNDAFKTKEDIGTFISFERAKINESLIDSMATFLRVENTVGMGLVSDVKQELRKANALKLYYAAPL